MSEIKEFKLTEGQSEALEAINTWWKGKEQDFVLSGMAGTGKTTIAGKFTNSIPGIIPSFTAPTHEAVRQLQRALGCSSEDLRTTHNFLGLQLSTHSFKQKLFQKSLPEDFNDYNLLIVDEASMAGLSEKGSKKPADLINYAKDSGIRILWMGDWAQLPPVSAEDGISPVFGMGFSSYELTEVKRHSGAILDFSKNLREVIQQSGEKNLTMSMIGETETVKRNSEGLIDLSSNAFEEIISGDASIICWTNGRKKLRIAGAAEYNRLIRSRLFGAGLAMKEDVYPTDKILFAEPVMQAKAGEKEANTVEAHERLTIDSLGTKDFITRCSTNTRGEIISTKPVTLLGIECFKSLVEIEGGSNITVFIPTNNGAGQLKKALSAFAKLAIDAGGAKDAGKAWHFYHTFKSCFADVRHTYCITTHRSQGSNMRSVYADVGNILQNRDRLVAFKSLYVAVTRAQETLRLIRG